jgi:hypothetical protein
MVTQFVPSLVCQYVQNTSTSRLVYANGIYLHLGKGGGMTGWATVIFFKSFEETLNLQSDGFSVSAAPLPITSDSIYKHFWIPF